MLDPAIRTAWPVLVLTAAFLTFIDVIIDPVALRGDRWFLGLIYGYPDPGVYFGIPLMNFVGWAVVGLIALSIYFVIDRRLPPALADATVTRHLLLGCGLYYGVLTFNLTVTFWIGEPLLGLVGIMIYLPVTLLFMLPPAQPISGAIVLERLLHDTSHGENVEYSMPDGQRPALKHSRCNVICRSDVFFLQERRHHTIRLKRAAGGLHSSEALHRLRCSIEPAATCGGDGGRWAFLGDCRCWQRENAHTGVSRGLSD